MPPDHPVPVLKGTANRGALPGWATPNYKVKKGFAPRRIRLMEEAGITFKCNSEVGTNISINDLLREYHAIVLAGGSTIPRDLPIPGRDLKGVHFAMDFLKQQNRRVSSLPVQEGDIWATNKNVVVIGGGDTGSDFVGTSNRHKTISVTQFELMPKPPHS